MKSGLLFKIKTLRQIVKNFFEIYVAIIED